MMHFNPAVNLDEDGKPLPREQQRVAALFLHDVVIVNGDYSRRHVRGSEAQLRGDLFDIELAAGRCVEASEAPAILPDPLPGDTVAPAAERARKLLVQSSGRADVIAKRKADEVADDIATRAALQATHDARGPLLEKREVEMHEAKLEAENEARAAKRKKKDS